MRNTLKYVSYKDKKEFASDLKSIYLAATETQAMENLDKVTEKWEEKYPNSMSSWYQNWDVLTPIFKFSLEVRKVIYTTNAIESLNSTYKKLNESIIKSVVFINNGSNKEMESTIKKLGESAWGI